MDEQFPALHYGIICQVVQMLDLFDGCAVLNRNAPQGLAIHHFMDDIPIRAGKAKRHKDGIL
jgi:hypothetical protein